MTSLTEMPASAANNQSAKSMMHWRRKAVDNRRRNISALATRVWAGIARPIVKTQLYANIFSEDAAGSLIGGPMRQRWLISLPVLQMFEW